MLGDAFDMLNDMGMPRHPMLTDNRRAQQPFGNMMMSPFGGFGGFGGFGAPLLGGMMGQMVAVKSIFKTILKQILAKFPRTSYA